jgi:hypothetical protein
MLFHVHHVDVAGNGRVRESFPQYETAKRLATDLIKVYGGRSYVTQAGLTQWDSDAASFHDYARERGVPHTE